MNLIALLGIISNRLLKTLAMSSGAPTALQTAPTGRCKSLDAPLKISG